MAYFTAKVSFMRVSPGYYDESCLTIGFLDVVIFIDAVKSTVSLVLRIVGVH